MTLGFYSNDGVCIFKYLVTQGDPQWIFSIIVVITNFACFVVIAASYIIIVLISKRSSQNAGNAKLPGQTKLQGKVSAIIVTDFCCWIPLCTTSLLHYGEVIDASSWYVYFSILILPINSVINPMLYDPTIFKYMIEMPLQKARKIFKVFSNTCAQLLVHQDLVIREEFEMTQIDKKERKDKKETEKTAEFSENKTDDGEIEPDGVELEAKRAENVIPKIVASINEEGKERMDIQERGPNSDLEIEDCDYGIVCDNGVQEENNCEIYEPEIEDSRNEQDDI